MADLKHAKDLQPSYDLALSHNGTEKWADNFAVRMIERIDDLERQLAEAYDALGNVNRGVYLHDHIFALKQQLAEMTADRNLWKDDHDGDCPYKTQLAEAKKLAEWAPITPHNLPKVGWEVGRTSANDPLGPYNVRDVREVSQILIDTCCDMDSWIFCGYRVTRPIAPLQPAEAEWSWQCNECGADEYTSSISEEDISKEMYSCGNCGSTEFHKVMPL